MQETKTISVNDLDGPALAWAVGVQRGRATRAPVPAKDADVENLAVPFTLYEVETTSDSDGDTFAKSARVRPIEVTRYGVNKAVGATAPSISFRDADGRKALGSVDMFYLTPEEAAIEAQIALCGAVYDGYDPADDWNECGRIIEELDILFSPSGEAGITAYTRNAGLAGPVGVSDDYRTAVLRCFMHVMQGPMVTVPADLVP